MANRLNVLVGATLEQNVEKKLNTELAKLNLNALELEAKFDNNFQNIVDNIKKAISAIDFTKINNGLNQVPDVFSQIKNATNGIADGVKIVDKVTRDLNGNLKTTEQRFKAIDNKELNVKVNYDDSGNVNSNKSSFTITDNDGKARLDKQKQVLKLYEKTSEELLKQRGYLEETYKGSLEYVHVEVLDSFIAKTKELGKELRENNLSMEQLLKLENELNEQANTATKHVRDSSKEYDETNQAIADAYADREKIHKQNADREQRAFDEEQKRNQERKQLLQNLYSTYTETEKKTKSLSDTYGNLIDVDNKKFFKQAEANSYAKSLDKIAQKLVDNEHNTEALLEVQKELDDLLSKLDARDKELDSQVKADDKAKVARKKYNDEVKKSKDLLADLKKTATDSRAKLENLKSAFPEVDFSEEEKEVRSLEGAVRSYEKTVNATGKSTEYFVDQQRKLKGWNSTAKSTSSGLDERLEYEIELRQEIAAEEDKLNQQRYQKDLRLNSQIEEAKRKAAEEEHKRRQKELDEVFDAEGKQFLAAIEEQEKEKAAAREKASKEELAAYQKNLRANSLANAELNKTAELYDTVRAKVKELKNSYAGTIGDTGQFDAFEKELEEIISDMARYSNSAEVMIKLQERLNRVLNSADASNSFNSSIQSMIASFNAETEREVTRLRSQYGAAFNEADYRERRNLEKEIADIIKTQGYNLNACRQAKSKLISQSKDFTTNLKASAKEIKEIEEKAELLNTSLGRFVQFYGFGELFRGLKTAFTNMFEQIKLVDAGMVELRKVTNETEYAYDKFLTNSAEKAKELGVTISDYINSVTEFARMGYSFAESQEIAKTANIMQMVSENLTADEASEYLISTMAGFNIEAEESMRIVDALNNVSNNFAVTTDG